MEWGRKVTGFILFIVCIFLLTNQSFYSYINIPDTLTVFESEWSSDDKESVIKNKLQLEENNHIQVDAEDSSAVVKVAALPKKKTSIQTLPDIKVIPGGDSIGVKLQSNGVMIVGFHEVNGEKERYSPAKKAGLKAGDRIIEINGQKVEKPADVIDVLDQSKDTIEMKYKRENEEKKTNVKLYNNRDKNVMGAYIRSAASGVGTLTFYEPNTGKFGALGHVIADATTKKPVVVENGEIVRSSVTSIDRGANGTPGEKQASLSTEKQSLGEVTKNTPFGVFGKLQPGKLKSHGEVEPLPIAFADEVEKGPAEILTVLEGEEIETFDIEIVQTIPQIQAASKGMVIKVTDERLLEKTNGIIQGMSGSPIIQNGKLVGAVTHVFVNDSTSGYGCHIEWMLDEAGIDTLQKERKEAAA
ncbi:SpoIVB peptidase [Alteribacillus iranensis]|uniref:SpoIVB peptidase. Serine peptidase. MEROPS family S55 n=1 Tax=Alteribacillus iranensis TaxID=930128 RepID=A0A1I1ZI08_9BACI|nr:SpoIVB peptidase [Alteribacillus iranensis]SFE31339.1 SpoIVB peptidase. Serine peptidase. MEROPS family S55 [Alteribacillus iranensis]